MRTSTIRQSIQSLRSGAQMGIAVKKPLIRRLHPGCSSVSSSSSLSLPLLDRLTDILLPLFQELCMPVGRGCLLFLSLGFRDSTHLSWFNKCVFASASPQIHFQNRNTSTFVGQTESQKGRKPKMDGVDRHYTILTQWRWTHRSAVHVSPGWMRIQSVRLTPVGSEAPHLAPKVQSSLSLGMVSPWT